jgi:hypothetical protein
LMILVIVLYGFAALDVVQFAAAVAAHFLVGWVYLFLAVGVSPKVSARVAAVKNPFAIAEEKSAATKPPENPFARKPVDEG